MTKEEFLHNITNIKLVADNIVQELDIIKKQVYDIMGQIDVNSEAYTYLEKIYTNVSKVRLELPFMYVDELEYVRMYINNLLI